MTFDDATWFKSSRSSGGGNNCVEVAVTPEVIGVRDTKDRGAGPILTFTPAQWNAFVGGVRGGAFDASV